MFETATRAREVAGKIVSQTISRAKKCDSAGVALSGGQNPTKGALRCMLEDG
jgi:hypothetical protein